MTRAQFARLDVAKDIDQKIMKLSSTGFILNNSVEDAEHAARSGTWLAVEGVARIDCEIADIHHESCFFQRFAGSGLTDGFSYLDFAAGDGPLAL